MSWVKTKKKLHPEKVLDFAARLDAGANSSSAQWHYSCCSDSHHVMLAKPNLMPLTSVCFCFHSHLSLGLSLGQAILYPSLSLRHLFCHRDWHGLPNYLTYPTTFSILVVERNWGTVLW